MQNPNRLLATYNTHSLKIPLQQQQYGFKASCVPFEPSRFEETSLVTYVHSTRALSIQNHSTTSLLVVQNVKVFSFFPLLLFRGWRQIVVRRAPEPLLVGCQLPIISDCGGRTLTK